MDSILRADSATQAEVYYKAVRSGWMLVDEIRYAKNLPALPNGIGKQALVSQDLATLDYTVNDKPKVLMSAVNRRENNNGGNGNPDSGSGGTGDSEPDNVSSAAGE